MHFKRYSATWDKTWNATGNAGYIHNTGIPLMYWNVGYNDVLFYITQVSIDLNINITVPYSRHTETMHILSDITQYSGSYVQLYDNDTRTYTDTLQSATYLIFPFTSSAYILINANIYNVGSVIVRPIDDYFYLKVGFSTNDCIINSNASTVHLNTTAIIA